MPTKYDVFSKVVEKGSCKHADLGFSTPVYAHLKKLMDEKFIRHSEQGYTPIKSPKTQAAFQIIKKCLKTGLNYNLFLSNEFKEVISNVAKSVPLILSKKIRNNASATRIIKYLEQNQFILIYSKRVKIGWLLDHTLYKHLGKFHGFRIITKDTRESYETLENELLKIPRSEINPFDTSYFENIVGSAQLEGSTVTVGETIEMLMKNIYPQKHHEDIQMIKNLNEAMHYVFNNLDEPINREHIKNINSRVLFSLHKGAGEFKKSQNKIQGNPSFKTTPPHLVEEEIEKFCSLFNHISQKDRGTCIYYLGEIHNQFQRIHPFSDGNSRTTRIILNWLLVKFGFPLLTLKAGSFDKYMSLTKLAEARYDRELRDFLCHVLYHEYLIN